MSEYRLDDGLQYGRKVGESWKITTPERNLYLLEDMLTKGAFDFKNHPDLAPAATRMIHEAGIKATDPEEFWKNLGVTDELYLRRFAEGFAIGALQDRPIARLIENEINSRRE